MALIKCSECGQMVSDKASACPHCGCPIEKPKMCPECGQVIADDDSYCPECGHQVHVDASDNSQVEVNQIQGQEQEDYSWDDDSSHNPMLWALLAVAALAIIGGVSWYLNQGTPNAKTEEEVLLDTVPDMAAPIIELNADGMYTIDDCPTTYEGLTVEPKITNDGRLSSVIIKRGDEVLQAFNTNSSHFENVKNVVHFLDANFDGFVDFMVGADESEQSSALFLWSAEDSKFVQAMSDGNLSFTDAGYYGYSFHPQSQKVYCHGYSDYNIQYLMSWIGNDLRVEEEFIQVFPPSMYYDNVNHRYTILDSNTRKVLFSSDEPKQIPDRWKKMARVLTPQEESEFAQSDAEWLQGTWRYKGYYEGTYLDVTLDIHGDRLVEKWNGKVEYNGEYDYVPSDKMIVYNDGKNVIQVKPDEQLIVFTGDLNYSKSGDQGSTTSSSTNRSSKSSGMASRLENSCQGDIDDLYYMARTGQMNPANIMFIKQNLPRQIRELIDLYRQEGNSEKVSEWTYKLEAVESVLSQIRI